MLVPILFCEIIGPLVEIQVPDLIFAQLHVTNGLGDYIQAALSRGFGTGKLSLP